MPDLTIVALGTSLTAEGGWLEALSPLLEKRLNVETRTYNLAQSGVTSTFGFDQMTRAVQLDPDVILIEFATNDSAIHNCITVRESCRNMATIVEVARRDAPKATLFLMAMNPVLGRKKLARWRLAKFNAAHRRLAHKRGIVFVDHRPQWRKLGLEGLRKAIPDRVHPFPEYAQKVILPTLVDAIIAKRNS